MSELGGLNDHPDLDSSESKSSASQESGLCSTMLAMDESLGSLEELSHSVHQQLNNHIDHANMMQYELDMLRAQLAEKNRLIFSQQATIKQLQDALSASHKEVKEMRKATETEITCKDEAISILQSDLVECQQQYADCFQQVVDQDRLLSGIREDDAVLIQKIAFLETQLRKKTIRTIATQTELPSYNSSTSNSFRCAPPYNPPPAAACNHQKRFGNNQLASERESRKSFFNGILADLPISGHAHLQSPSPTGESGSYSALFGAKPEAKPSWNNQYQDLLSEIRQIQKVLQSEGQRPGQCVHHQCSDRVKKNEQEADFWNTLTEERQHRLQLDTMIRQMELDMLEIKNQVQSCKARLQVQSPQWNCCSTKQFSPAPTKHCCPCANESIMNPPASATLYTLV